MNKDQQAEELEVLESIYGSDWKKEIDGDSSYSIQVQPDVTLFLTLNSSYPSEAPPTYTLLAPTLNKMKKRLIAQSFDEIYLENIGCPVLFQWIEKLKELIQAENDSVEELSQNNVDVKGASSQVEEEYDCHIIHGPIIQDRKSVFQGHVCEVHSENDIRKVTNVLLKNKKIAQATHNISAYRIEKDKVMIQDFDDDGENHAGGRLLHLLQITGVKNVLVIVSRWYGGIQLGPDRFRHINNAARQVLEQTGYIR